MFKTFKSCPILFNQLFSHLDWLEINFIENTALEIINDHNLLRDDGIHKWAKWHLLVFFSYSKIDLEKSSRLDIVWSCNKLYKKYLIIIEQKISAAAFFSVNQVI